MNEELHRITLGSEEKAWLAGETQTLLKRIKDHFQLIDDRYPPLFLAEGLGSVIADIVCHIKDDSFAKNVLFNFPNAAQESYNEYIKNNWGKW